MPLKTQTEIKRTGKARCRRHLFNGMLAHHQHLAGVAHAMLFDKLARRDAGLGFE
jgi:hypothetical protein